VSAAAIAFGDFSPGWHGRRLIVARTLWRVRRDARRGTWYVDARPHGRIYSIPVGRGQRLPLRTEDAARDLLAAIRRDVEDGLSPEAAVSLYLSDGVRLGQYVQPYLVHWRRLVEAGERSPTSLREIERYAVRHWEPLLALPPHSIRYGALEDWLGWLGEPPRSLAPKTRANALAAFRAFLGWLERRGELRQLPRFPEVSVTRPAPTIISVETQEMILAEISEPKRGIFYALVELLVRPGEARALNVSDYDRRERRLVIAAAMKGPRADSPRRATKTGDVRVHTASDRLAGWIEAHVERERRLRGDAPLFLNPEPQAIGRWTHAGLSLVWGAACVRVGVRVKLYEGTKHSTATALRRAGVPLDVIQHAAGHRDIRSTELYARLGDQAIVEALRRRER
jgi:integrase